MPTLDKTTVRVRPEAAVARSPRNSAADRLSELLATPAIPKRYEILSEIGRGGMGIVYRVRDVDTLEILALKILKPEIARDPAMRENLRQEVCLARKVTHKNVCRIHEFNRFQSTACISMELIDGESLLARLREKGALSPFEAVEIARQICAGLGEAHAQNIVHRDLKPANVMISADHVVKLMDFGIARKASETGDPNAALAGTPAYMAPEQVESKPLSARTDIYSLGLVLYEMVTGDLPFHADNAGELALLQINQVPAPPSKLVPTLPARLESVILKCLQKRPKDRFSSVREVCEALETSLHATPGEILSEAVLIPAKIAVTSGAETAVTWLDRAALTICALAKRTNDVLPPKWRQWNETVFGLRGFSRPIRTAQVVLVFGATLLSTSVVFGFLTHSQTRAAGKGPLPAVVSRLTNVLPGPGNAHTFATSSSFGAQEFDFATANAVTTTQDNTDVSVALAPQVKPSVPATANAHPILAAKSAKPQALTPQTQMLQPTALQASDPQAAYVEALRTSPLPVDSGAYSPSLLAPLMPVPAADDTSAGPDLKSGVNDNYLEVGTFSEAAWADDAVNHLTEMGFHAICVHKTHLWAQSYRVEVGPFEKLKDLEDTAAALTAKGFKPHAVK